MPIVADPDWRIPLRFCFTTPPTVPTLQQHKEAAHTGATPG
jgi:hypothetical protein